MIIGICRPKAGVNGLSSGDQVFYGVAKEELNYSEIGSSTYYVQVGPMTLSHAHLEKDCLLHCMGTKQ